jgi:hypothetical protein
MIIRAELVPVLCRVQVSTWSTTFYSQTAGQIKGWWLNYDVCTRALKALCEVPHTAFTCPPAPPPAPPPVPPASLCKKFSMLLCIQ